MKNSIVFIRNDYGRNNSWIAGSGVIYSTGQKNYVITSRHVADCRFERYCEPGSDELITVRFSDGTKSQTTQVLYPPYNLDFALLAVDTLDEKFSVPIHSTNYVRGSSVFAIGYPQADIQSANPVLQFSVTEGKITAIRESITNDGGSFKNIQADAFTSGGNSGGGLFLEEGALVGILTWSNGAGTTDAIDIGTIDSLVNNNQLVQKSE
jgi:S1-C subfamily serine protease